MDDYCTITIDGRYAGTYYVPCNQVEYITKDFVNVSSSTINLYKNIRQGNNTDYISMGALSVPIYHYTSSTSTLYVDDVTSVQFNNKAQFIREFDICSLLLSLTIVLFLVINFFTRRHS